MSATEPDAIGRAERLSAFRARLARSLDSSRSVRVIYEDNLGEGPGGWDPDARFSTETTNCINWVYLVVAGAYAEQPGDEPRAMDRLRYYGGHPAFGLRKHFLDQFLELEPEPFRRVNLDHCAKRRWRETDVDFWQFASNHGYPCPLYRQDRTRYPTEYVDGSDLLNCARTLPAGIYVLFAVASSRYLEKYAKTSGPMGYVHGSILHLGGGAGGGRRDERIHLLSASIISHRVDDVPLREFLAHERRLFRGFALYELDPDWDFRRSPPPDPEMESILECERKAGARAAQPGYFR